MKWPVVLIGVVLIVGVLVFAISYGIPSESTISTSTSATSTDILPNTPSTLYTDTQLGFTIMHPDSSPAETTGFEQYLPVTGKPVVGFRLPQSVSTGTNLVEAGVFIGASSDGKALNSCTAPADIEKSLGTKTLSGIPFSVFSSTGAGAGNIYEETSYRAVRSGTCIEIVELLHSGNIGNYPSGQVHEFDHDAMRSILDRMVSTLVFTGTAGSGVQGTITVTCATDTSDPACVPQIRTIEAYQGVSAVGLFKTSQDGTFRAALPPGQYELRVDTASSTHCVSEGIVVTDNSYITTNISCEAGVQE